jgi:hypothetical protein
VLEHFHNKTLRITALVHAHLVKAHLKFCNGKGLNHGEASGRRKMFELILNLEYVGQETCKFCRYRFVMGTVLAWSEWVKMSDLHVPELTEVLQNVCNALVPFFPHACS